MKCLKYNESGYKQGTVRYFFGLPSLMGDIGAKIPSYNAVPGGIVLLVKLLLDIGCNVLLYIILFQGLSGTIHSILDKNDNQ
jgi:hypothetical protein